MTTFNDLVSETLLQLEGFVGDQAVVGTLTGSITASDAVLTVAGDKEAFSTGVWEIEEELVYVRTYDRGSGTTTNVIRGWRGTAPASHSTGALVTSNPRFPVAQVKKAINNTILNLYPRIPALKTTTITMAHGKSRYILPSNVRNVLSVAGKIGTDNDALVPLDTWKFVPLPVGVANNGTVLEIDSIHEGTTVITYAAEPTAMTDNTDNFTTVTGLPLFTRETVIWGAMWRLYSMIELGRATVNSADQALLNQQAPVGKATDIAKYLLAMFQQNLAEAEQRVQDLIPVQKHYTW